MASETGRETAETVVSTEFDNHDFRMQGEDGREAANGVLGGGAAGALVDNFVVVAVCVEALLQEVRIGLAGLQAVARGNAIAKANQDLRASTKQRCGEESQED